MKLRRTATRAALAAAVFAAACSTELANAQTGATWLAGVTGTWTDAANWSTNPFYPQNDIPSGALYDVTIAASSSLLNYEVLIFSPDQPANIHVQSLLVGNPKALVQVLNGTFSVANEVTTSGGYFAIGGNATFSASVMYGVACISRTIVNTR